MKTRFTLLDSLVCVEVTGKDVTSFLAGMTTNQVKELKVGEGNSTFVLTNKGRILFELYLLRFERGFYVWMQKATQEECLAYLNKYIILEDVSFRMTPLQTVGLLPEFLSSFYSAWMPELPLPNTAYFAKQDSEAFFFRLQLAPTWEVLLTVAENVDIFVESLGEKGLKLSSTDWEEVCWQNGYGSQLYTQNLLVQETTLHESHVNFKKGCFIGQEVVARTQYRGQVKREISLLQCPKQMIPSISSVLSFGEEKIGEVLGCISKEEMLFVLVLLKREVKPDWVAKKVDLLVQFEEKENSLTEVSLLR